ncbi:hypothetical protein ADUPG1_000656, partial [Aduncisulcus paluster]
MDYHTRFIKALVETLGHYIPRSIAIDSTPENADCFYQALLVAMGFDQALLPHLAPALKARTVLNMFLTHRLSTEELKTELLPSSLAHNAHYMQAACDMGVCIWFLSLEDKHLAIYNSPADGLARRVYMGWHEKHVRPVFFKRALPVGQMAAKGW